MAELSREQIERAIDALEYLANYASSNGMGYMPADVSISELKAALTALSDDSVRVPREPTEEMIDAYLHAQKEFALNSDAAFGVSDPRQNFRAGYKAMSAALAGSAQEEVR
jgi:hypothetical protein